MCERGDQDPSTPAVRTSSRGPARSASDPLSYKLGPQTHGSHPWLDYQGGGGTGGPFDVSRFKTGGITIEGGGPQPPPAGFNPRAPGAIRKLKFQWDVNGLVPDGVASVTIKLTGKGRYTHLFGHPVAYYRQHPTTNTVRVVENAFFIKLPADPASAAHQTLLWKDASGRILKTARPG